MKNPKVNAVLQFLQFCFRQTEDIILNGPIASTFILFNVALVSLRLAICDLGSCFCFASLPGAVLRESLAFVAANEFATSLRTFGYCLCADEI